MDSLSLATRSQGGSSSAQEFAEAAPHRQRGVELIVASFGDSVAEDYAAYVSGTDVGVVSCSLDPCGSNLPKADCGRVSAVVLFLKPRLTDADRRALDDFFERATQFEPDFLAIVNNFQAHFGSRDAEGAEAGCLARATRLFARAVVFRHGFVLSPNPRASFFLGRFGFVHPLIPNRLRSCFLDGNELFAAIEAERLRSASSPFPVGRQRTLTLLGPNARWRDQLAQHRGRGARNTCLMLLCALLSVLLIGEIAALLLFLALRVRNFLLRSEGATWGHWNFTTLRPGSMPELLALYNRYNYRHVKVVGYNNGVVHFGQRFPGKTVVSTVNCHRVVLTGKRLLKADCGATVRRAADFLSESGLELPVVPNYSYVALGTSFFIPIHGSAADFSTVADTITRVILYDPARARLIIGDRDDPAFREHVYNLRSEVLLLRLYLRTKPKSHYFVQRETLKEPNPEELLRTLRDPRATNVEIRESRASSDSVIVARYYSNPGAASAGALELPRDALGRLWDRLEENRVSSFLMHALTRRFAWHVELFFSADEFSLFWQVHQTLRLKKLQLRYIRRDGLPHSPFRDGDCVSVDLFTLRPSRYRLERFLTDKFPTVRMNPGKQSR